MRLDLKYQMFTTLLKLQGGRVGGGEIASDEEPEIDTEDEDHNKDETNEDGDDEEDGGPPSKLQMAEIMFREKPLSDNTIVCGKTWKELKLEKAMEEDFRQAEWYKKAQEDGEDDEYEALIKKEQRDLLDRLREAQTNQGDVDIPLETALPNVPIKKNIDLRTSPTDYELKKRRLWKKKVKDTIEELIAMKRVGQIRASETYEGCEEYPDIA